MKRLIFMFSLLGIFSANAQVSDNTKKQIVDSTVKTKSRFISDPTTNTFSQSDLFKEVDPSGFDLFNANVSFADKDQVQKVGFSPLRLVPNWYHPVLSNLRLNATNSGGALTTGFSVGYDGSALDNPRLERLAEQLAND